MKSHYLLSLFVLLLCLGRPAMSEEYRTTLFVRNNGKPVRASEVVFRDIDNIAGKSANRIDSASYVIKRPKSQGMLVQIFAPNAKNMEFFVNSTNINDTIIVDLAPLPLRLGFFRLYGNYNDFEKGSMLPFTADSGVFHVTVKSGNKSLVYSLIGDTGTGGKLCDMNADSIIFKNGEFFSVRNSETGSFDFDIAMKDLSPVNTGAAVNSPNNEELNTAFGLFKKTNEKKISFFASRPVQVNAISEYLKSIEQLIANATSEYHRRIFAHNYLDVAAIVVKYYEPNYEFNKDFLRSCIDKIPACDALWLKNPNTYINSLLISEHPSADSLLQEFIKIYRSTEYAYNAIDLIASFYKSKRDISKLSRLVAIVEKEKELIPNSNYVLSDAKSFLDGGSKSDSSFVFISLQDTSKTFEISDFQGNYVLVDFWATWCTACIREIKTTLAELNKELPADRFVLLSISTDNNIDKVIKFFKSKINAPWVFGIMPNGSSYMSSKFNNNYLPFKILYNPDGKIIAWGDDLSADEITGTDKKKVFALWKKLKTAIVKQDKKTYGNLFYYEANGNNYSIADWWPTTKQEFIIGFDSFFSSMYRNKLKSNKETEEEFIFKNGKEKIAELWLQLSYDLRTYSFKKYGDGKWYVYRIQKVED